MIEMPVLSFYLPINTLNAFSEEASSRPEARRAVVEKPALSEVE
jgi:hypothetical protein